MEVRTVADVVLGAVLVGSALAKLAAPRASADGLATFGVRGAESRRAVWALLVAAEASLGVLVALVFSKFVYTASITSYYTFYLIEKFDVSVRNAQIHLFVFLASVALGTLLGGALGDRFGRKAVIWGSILGVLPFAIALPFFVVYFRSPENWWAIIPAGVMTTLTIITTLAIAGLIRNAEQGGYANAILLGGIAVTFAIVWLRNEKAWAKVVTIILAALAVASVFLAAYTEIFWPMAIILAGGYLLYTAMRPKAV